MTTGAEVQTKLLLDKEAVASLLSVEVSTVAYLDRIGALRGVKIGKSVVWKPEHVAEFVRNLEPRK